MKTKDEAKAYLEALGKKAGLDENGIKALLANDEVLEDARNHLTRHDEMASGIDRAKNEAKAKLDELDKWYRETANPTYLEAQKIRAEHQKYRDTFGELEGDGTGNGNGRGADGKFVSRQDLDNMSMSGVQVAKKLAFITSDYNYRFGSKYGAMTPEQLDEFEKFAVSRGVDPIVAYREWVAPKNKELSDAEDARKATEFEAKLKAAREEGFREGQTRKKWGTETTKQTDAFGRDPEAVKLAKTSPEDADAAGDRAFMEAWETWDHDHAGTR